MLGEAGTRHWDSEDSASWTPPPPGTPSSSSSSWSPAWLVLVLAVADLVMRLLAVLVLVSPLAGLNTDLENSRRLLCFTLMLSPAGMWSWS